MVGKCYEMAGKKKAYNLLLGRCRKTNHQVPNKKNKYCYASNFILPKIEPLVSLLFCAQFRSICKCPLWIIKKMYVKSFSWNLQLMESRERVVAHFMQAYDFCFPYWFSVAAERTSGTRKVSVGRQAGLVQIAAILHELCKLGELGYPLIVLISLCRKCRIQSLITLFITTQLDKNPQHIL